MLHLANIKQGNRSLADYGSQFQLLMNRAGIKDGVPMGTFFGKGLSPFLTGLRLPRPSTMLKQPSACSGEQTPLKTEEVFTIQNRRQ